MKDIIFNNQSITPSKLVCIGRNYLEHINELNNEVPDDMVIFLKPNSAIGDQLLAVRGAAEHAETIHFETEICFLYQQGRFSAVAVGLDLTKRALQSRLKEKQLPWERAKAFNGAALFSEFVAIDTVSDQLNLRLEVDGELTQAGGVLQMMYSPAAILNELATFMDLEDGDIIMTGTPAGVGPLRKNSEYVCSVFDGDELLIKQAWPAL